MMKNNFPFLIFFSIITILLQNSNGYSQNSNQIRQEKYQTYLEGKLVIDFSDRDSAVIYSQGVFLQPLRGLLSIDYNIAWMYDIHNGIADIGYKSNRLCLRISQHNKMLLDFTIRPFNGTLRANLSSPMVLFKGTIYAPLTEIMYHMGYDITIDEKNKKILLKSNQKRYAETEYGILCFSK